MSNQSDTYPKPAHGWTCFHCGETFMTPGGARDHFGVSPASDLACRIKIGDERGLIMALRKAEAELCHIAAENYALQTDLAIIKREKANVINKLTVGDVTTMPAPEEMIGKGITDYHTLPKSEEVIELPLGSEFAYPISKIVVIKV